MADPVARFVTIPLSHYCERARWALDLSGIRYREESHVPLFHRIATSRAGGRTVPVLVIGRDIFDDSAAIVHWVNQSVPRQLIRRAYRIDPARALPAAMRAEVEAVRATPAGQLAMRLYEEDRPRPISPFDRV